MAISLETNSFIFTRSEFVGVLAILLAVFGFSYFNFIDSQGKARDEQRKASARLIVNGLESYHKDFGVFPPAKDGKIVACGEPQSVRVCEWGRDALRDLRDSSYEPYLNPIPLDPRQGQGHSYYYVSTGSEFQLFSSLERRVDPEWSAYVNSLDLKCGEKICNYGITLSRKPVKRLLE